MSERSELMPAASASEADGDGVRGRSPRGGPMTWRIAVRHRTGYQYETPARASYNEVRMTPATVSGQHALQSNVDTSPLATKFRYVDYWGTVVHAFDVHQPHTELVVTATSVVETAGAHKDAAAVLLDRLRARWAPRSVRRVADAVAVRAR